MYRYVQSGKRQRVKRREKDINVSYCRLELETTKNQISIYVSLLVIGKIENKNAEPKRFFRQQLSLLMIRR